MAQVKAMPKILDLKDMIPISTQLAMIPPRPAEPALIREYDPHGFRTELLKKSAIDP
jgi:hypothetical protein